MSMSFHSAVLKSSGAAWAWGVNSSGQLGNDTVDAKSSPTLVVGNHSFIAITAGDIYSVALKANGEPWAWGAAASGRLGDNQIDYNKNSPVKVVGNHLFIAISTGDSHTIALKANGEAWGWGSNSSGKLGDGTPSPRYRPVSVVGAHSFEAIAAGDTQSLALKVDGAAWAWGLNSSGQLGDGTTSIRYSPVSVIGNHTFTSIVSGDRHSAALKSNGEAWAWGYGSTGSLGDNTNVNKSSPVSVVGNHSFVAITTGSSHVVALKANGEAWAWGAGSVGRLGNNSTDNKSSPVSVVGDHSFIAIGAGQVHTLALKANGETWAWGSNSSGRLGDNTTDDRSSPVLVVGSHVFATLMNAQEEASISSSSSSFSSSSNSFSSSSYSSYSISVSSSSFSSSSSSFSSSSFSSSSNSFSSSSFSSSSNSFSSSSYSSHSISVSSSSSSSSLATLAPEIVWDIATTGDDNNGAGYSDLNPGSYIDYSQQDVAQLSPTDLAMTAGTVILTSASGGFTAPMIGNCIYIRSGVNFVVDYYQITGYHSPTSVDIDRDATNGSNASGGSGNVGGRRRTITADFLNSLADGNTVFVKEGTYTLSGDLNITNLGSPDADIVSEVLTLKGYQTVHDDYPFGDDRPLIVAGSNVVRFPSYWVVSCLRLQTGHADGLRITGSNNWLVNCKVEQTSIAGHGINIDSGGSDANRVIQCTVFCSAESSTGYGIRVDGFAVVLDTCKVWDFAEGIYQSSARHSLVVTNSRVSGCTNGINLQANRAYLRWVTVYGCDIGIKGNFAINVHIRNCIIDSCISFGVQWTGAQIVFLDWNNWHANGADISGAGITKGSYAKHTDPLFVAPANNNFALPPGSPLRYTGASMRLGVGSSSSSTSSSSSSLSFSSSSFSSTSSCSSSADSISSSSSSFSSCSSSFSSSSSCSSSFSSCSSSFSSSSSCSSSFSSCSSSFSSSSFSSCSSSFSSSSFSSCSSSFSSSSFSSCSSSFSSFSSSSSSFSSSSSSFSSSSSSFSSSSSSLSSSSSCSSSFSSSSSSLSSSCSSSLSSSCSSSSCSSSSYSSSSAPAGPAVPVFYQCATWWTGAESDSSGGDINLAAPITSGSSENIFDDVSNSERVAGDVEYRKIYVRNEGGSWSDVLVWIQRFSRAFDDDILITTQGNNSDTQATAKTYTYYSPSSRVHADVQSIGALAPNGYHHIWIKRIIGTNIPGYTGNKFQLAVEGS